MLQSSFPSWRQSRRQPKLHTRTARIGVTFLALAALGLAAHPAQAQNPLITFNESGQGTITFPGTPPASAPGVLAADPGPGGLASALTYNLLGPPSIIAGDLLLTEGGTTVVSDVIRFNPAGTGAPSYPASVVFYSTAGSGALADTGLPTAFYSNTSSVLEVNGLASYTPTANQPGFVPGFGVSYRFTSDAPAAVPEPSPVLTLAVAALGLGGLIVAAKRKKASAAS